MVPPKQGGQAMKTFEIYRNLTEEQKRNLHAGIYCLSITKARQLQSGGFIEVAQAGRLVRRFMNPAASGHAEEMGQHVATNLFK
mgnify:CR=1 FL=1